MDIKQALKMITIQEAFENLEDYRRKKSIEYPFIEILTISLCAIICGAESWREFSEFGNLKKDWLGKILKLENGIPSHDTFNRFFTHIDPDSKHVSPAGLVA